MRRSLKINLAAMAVTIAGIGSAQAQGQMRFQAMDTNHDGQISFGEWRGSEAAFRQQDWNGDGVLSGDEVRPGAKRQTSWNQDWNRDGIVDQQDTLIAQRFRNYDNNGDGRVSASEWTGNRALFQRLDTNRDGYLSMSEYTNNGGFNADSQGGPAFTFTNLDRNHDGWLTRNEWNMGAAEFNRLDVNRDNRISNYEFQTSSTGNFARDNEQSDQQTEQRFLAIDRNRDGWITRAESGMNNAEFNRLDTNNDNRLSRFEFETAASSDAYSPSSSASYSPNPNSSPVNDRFSAADRNGDGWLTRSEWRGTEATFTLLDTNRDNRLSRDEYDATVATNQPQSNRSAAWRSGYDRGIQEGRQAGREDYTNGHGWDLEGQTELEQADSGYNQQVGSRSDYQAGYRAGFRNAYREGFNTH
jgi:Ca2+-binding EF-hand superfamily protein